MSAWKVGLMFWAGMCAFIWLFVHPQNKLVTAQTCVELADRLMAKGKRGAFNLTPFEEADLDRCHD